MKKIYFLALAAASAASSAFAAPGSVYVAVDGGFQMTPGKVVLDFYETGVATKVEAIGALSFKKNTGTDMTGIKLDGLKNKGAFVSPKIGYVISDELRADIAFNYNFAKKGVLSFPAATKDAKAVKIGEFKVKSWDVLASVYYDFVNSSDFTPFLGLGVGYGSRSFDYASESVKDESDYGNALKTKIVDVSFQAFESKKSKGFVFGGSVGVSYKVNDNVSLQLAYSLKHLPKAGSAVPSKNLVEVIPTKALHAAHFKLKNLQHSVNAGVRFVF